MEKRAVCYERFNDIYQLLDTRTTIRIKSAKTGNIVMSLEKEIADCPSIIEWLQYFRIIELRPIDIDVIIFTIDDLDDEGEE